LMASFTWMGKQKKIISNNKDTAALLPYVWAEKRSILELD
jgi:hypothetical protein